jgi:hypothetical protein
LAATSGGAVIEPVAYIEGLTEERVRKLLQAPRHYGFHATLKALFRLTLTGQLHNKREQGLVALELNERFPARLLQNISLDALALFVEEDGQAFRCLARYPLLSA